MKTKYIRQIKHSLAVALSLVSVACIAEDQKTSALNPNISPAVTQGKAVFMKHCAACHSYGYGTDGQKFKPAVDALQVKYNGVISPFIEERSDLNAAVLKVFVRNGIKSMTPFRKTEITDTEIDAMAEYLKYTSSKKK